MHTLQPKHIKLKNEEIKKLTDEYNISVSQLPKIKADISDLQLKNASMTSEISSINKGVTRIEGKLDQLLQNLIKK